MDGSRAPDEASFEMALRWVETDDGSTALEWSFVSPFYHNRPPPPRDDSDSTGGGYDGLWNYEVCELFILGAEEEYTEIEVGPHGHYLILKLKGSRNVVETLLPLSPNALSIEKHASTWHARVVIPREYLPSPIIDDSKSNEQFYKMNAYAIHDNAKQRRYLAATPLQTREPDFHAIHAFKLTFSLTS